MAFLRRSIDAINNEIQFEVDETANSVNLKFNDSFYQAEIDNLKIRVERTSKNTPNQLLYSAKYSELKKVLSFAYPKMGNVLPFAIGKSLVLDESTKVLVTISVPPAVEEVNGFPTSFEFEVNKTLELTKSPLLIKTVQVDEEITVNSEFYPLFLVSKQTKSFETIVIVKDENGQDQPSKVFLGNELIKSQIQNEGDFLPFVTAKEQLITLKGNSTSYLILI